MNDEAIFLENLVSGPKLAKISFLQGSNKAGSTSTGNLQLHLLLHRIIFRFPTDVRWIGTTTALYQMRSAKSFHASERVSSFLHFQRAVEEFERDHNSEGKKLLFASNVHVKKWLNSGINWRMGHVFVEAIFKNGDAFTDNTVADLWIVKVQNTAHETAVAELSGLFILYRHLHGCLGFLDAGGGNMILPGCIRRPDTAIRPNEVVLNGQSDLPRVLFEVEFEHRSVAQAHDFVLHWQYFLLIQVLQAVVLFVFWGKRRDRSFAAIAILYRRNGAVGTAQDAVSFGSADIFPRALRHIPPCIRALPIRNLPNAPIAIPVHAPNPWNGFGAHQPFIRVPGVDLFHLGPAGTLIAGAPVPPPDFDIDLWTMYQKVKGKKF